jgi:hypothetical protein
MPVGSNRKGAEHRDYTKFMQQMLRLKGNQNQAPQRATDRDAEAIRQVKASLPADPSTRV